jgi:hypothetical protein
MAPNLCRSVRIEKPLSALGASLNEIRSWLDGHKIQPAGFRTNIADPHTIVIDIAFAKDDEARLFERKFVPERSGSRRREDWDRVHKLERSIDDVTERCDEIRKVADEAS